MTNQTWFLYEIECITNNCFYIGITKNFQRRIKQHSSKQGATWTKRHGVKTARILQEFPNENQAKAAEHKTVLELAKQGKFVRGASFSGMPPSRRAISKLWTLV